MWDISQRQEANLNNSYSFCKNKNVGRTKRWSKRAFVVFCHDKSILLMKEIGKAKENASRETKFDIIKAMKKLISLLITYMLHATEVETICYVFHGVRIRAVRIQSLRIWYSLVSFIVASSFWSLLMNPDTHFSPEDPKRIGWFVILALWFSSSSV